MTHYDTLNISQAASKETIKQSYRRLAQHFHPDKVTGNSAKFIQVRAAYDVLMDDVKRAAYNESIPKQALKKFKAFNYSTVREFTNLCDHLAKAARTQRAKSYSK